MTTSEYSDLQGKVALVTGASSGLGAHFAQLLAMHGCTVVLLARRKRALEQLAQSINTAGGQAVVMPADVTDLSQLEISFNKIKKQVGPVDIVINNAGVARGAPFLDASDSDTADVVAVNQTAVWRVAQLACQQMHVKGLASYATTKAAVIQMTKAIALEMAQYNIRVNAIAPGYCVTEINKDYLQSDRGAAMINSRVPMRRVGELHELDGVLLLLASQRGSYITGAVIPVDGGYRVGP